MRRAALALALGAAVLAAGCGRSFRTVRTARPRTLDPAVPCPAPSGPGRLLVTYRPATHRAKGEHPPVVLFEPLLLRKEVLERGLVPYLNYRGFPVWVVFADTPEALPSPALGRCHAAAIEAIATVTRARRLHVGGVSLGGEVAAHALGALKGTVALGRVFFYAAGIDYAYPGSLFTALAAGRGGPLAASCGDPGCSRWLSGGAGFLGVLPPRADDEDLPLAERFPHLAAAQQPVLFVNGKIDGAAPSESVFPVYELYGSASPAQGGVRKRIVIVGRENFLPDLDHWGMLSGAHEQGFEILADWLESE